MTVSFTASSVMDQGTFSLDTSLNDKNSFECMKRN